MKALREDLIENKVASKLKKAAIKFYHVAWKPGGIDPKFHPDHLAYLEKFCSHFINDMCDLIKEALLQKKELIPMSNYYSDYEETIHHLKFCVAKCETFCGQKNVSIARTSMNIGIIHVFLCNNICWTPRVVLKPEPERRGF